MSESTDRQRLVEYTLWFVFGLIVNGRFLILLVASRQFPLNVATKPKQNTSISGCCQRRGCLGRSSRSSRWLATLGQRRAVGVPIPASGTTRGPGPLIGGPSARSRHEVIPASRSSRPSGRPSSASGLAVCRGRAALGVVRTLGHARAWCPCLSFRRPYNTRLHQTAPRELFSFSPW